MFVKLYRYQIKANKFQQWKQITDRACQLYQKYGSGNTVRLFRKDDDRYTIIELDYYTSKEQYLTIQNDIDNDPNLKPLLNAFLNTIIHRQFIVEEFEAI